MALIGKQKFTQEFLLVEDIEKGQVLIEELFGIVVGTPCFYPDEPNSYHCWIVYPPQNADRSQFNKDIVIKQLTAQGYVIEEPRGNQGCLTLKNPNSPENAGATTDCPVVGPAKRASNSSGGCFIATACYGDYNHPDVATLRLWRDKKLMSIFAGRLFVKVYNIISPPLAAKLKRYPNISSRIKSLLLEPFAKYLKK